MGWLEVFRYHSQSHWKWYHSIQRTRVPISLLHCVRIFHHFWDIARYWSKIADFNLPKMYLVCPLGVIPFEFHHDVWHQKPAVLSYRTAKALFEW